MSSVSLQRVAELRALAHSARLDLLDLFRVHDRLTAAECARMLGTSTKSCSYHLGILARGGFVAQVAQPSGDGRERPWRRVADEWRDSVTGHARTAVMSADQLREWGEAVEAVTREHVRRARRDPSQRGRPVRLLIRGFPQEFAPLRASD